MSVRKLIIRSFLFSIWLASVIASVFFSQQMVAGTPTHRVFMPRAGYIDVVSNPPWEARTLALYAIFSTFAGVYVFSLLNRKREEGERDGKSK